MTARSDHTEYPLKASQEYYLCSLDYNYVDFLWDEYGCLVSYVELQCDKNKLWKHLVRVLKYNKTDASTLTQQITNFLSRERNQQDEPLQLTNKDIPAEIFRVIIQCISPAQRYEILSGRSNGVLALFQYIYWKRNDIVEIILDSMNRDECYHLLKHSHWTNFVTPLASACRSGNTELVMIIQRHVSKDNWYQLLQQHGSYYVSPLLWAVSRGHINIVQCIQALVTAEQWYELLKLKSKKNALHKAASKGHTEVIMFIHQSVTAKQWYELLQMKDGCELTAIHPAASKSQTHVTDFIRETLSTDKWMSLLTVPPRPTDSFFQYHKKRIEDLVRIETKLQLAINTYSEQGKHNLNFSFENFLNFG